MDKNIKKILFMGTPDYATTILKALLDDKSFEVIGVFTQPDKPVGRRQVLTPPHIKGYLTSSKKNIKIFQPATLKEESIQNKIRDLKPDFIVVAAYGQILPKEILQIAPCINLHASLLPMYRGASPIQSTILNCDRFGGVTAMLMDEGLDTGDILAYSVLKTGKNTTIKELFDKLSLLAAKLSVTTLKEFDKIAPIKQHDLLTSYSKKISKSDGLVSLESADELFIKFRALHPWPGIFLKNQLKIKDMSINDDKNEYKNEGEIISIENETVVISCKRGSVTLKLLQPPSKKVVSAKEYILGKRLKVGDNIL